MNHGQAIRMVFVDLDGTLLQGVDTVTPRTIEAFRKIRAAGITPVIATGRLAYDSDFASRAIGADGYLISMNGLAVYRDYRTGSLLYEAYMDEKAVLLILDRLLREKIFFQAYAGNRAYCQTDHAELIHQCGMDKSHATFFSQSQHTVDDLRDFLLQNKIHINKFFVSMEDTTQIPFLRAALNAIPGVKTFLSSKNFIDVVPKGADKQRAVRAICEASGLKPSQVMVIGDSENDLGMFEEALTCVAMGNACPALKAKANYIAPSNMENGVAWALETLLLGESVKRFTGHIEILRKDEIEASLIHSTRQYLAGCLKLPQQLAFLPDRDVEVGISQYPHYRWEQPHYHTITSEYCYILEGETKYVDLSDNTEYHFHSGDFYILRRETPYIQKCLPGCRLFFVKVPGLNDKVPVPLTDAHRAWSENWDAVWDTSELHSPTPQEEKDL